MLDLIKQYAYKRADLLKMEVTEKSVSIAGTITYMVLAIVCAVFFLMLLLVGLGLLIGQALDNYGLGVLIIAGVCLLIIVLIFVLRNSIRNFIADKILDTLDD